eukprot:TRINITY_DN4379_c0_g1_i1.p1 TRINITY_DN4379_c0_g1~~TRINITY_DN4379_c0_g1_i1.p1  ORF type:complete len:848 (-),score=257.52 TRINITY_DN4379_c0_g1_i1:165-2708(-)
MTFLSLPLKRATNIDVTKSIKSAIKPSESLSKDQLDSILKDFQNLRVKAIKVNSSGGDPSLESVCRYFDQLASLESKIPIHEVQIPFKYKDAFDKGGLFGARAALTVSSLLFEKVGMLFNLAVLHANSAVEQNLSSGEGLQSALKKMQTAGGIFQYLRENAVALIQVDPTPDLEPDTLGVLSELMLAQAQEAITLKAIHDNMKSSTLSKLCKQVDVYYSATLTNMQKEGLKHLWESHWVTHIGTKQAYYAGLAHYYLGKLAAEEMKIGPAIARFQHSESLFKASLERASPIGGDLAAKVKSSLQKNTHELAEVKKDNDFIYHERVPDIRSMEAPTVAPVAKLTPFAYETRYSSGDDIFRDLLPVQITHALNTFQSRKDDKANQEICKLKSATDLLNDLLSSMNLPAAIEETSGDSLPSSLIDKSNKLVESGGLDSLEGKMKEMPSLVQRNSEILEECDRMIKEEENTDTKLREQFKEKWTRTPSSNLSSLLMANSQKYHTLLDNALKAEEVINSRFEENREGIELLSKGPGSLKSIVPRANAPGYASNSPAVIALRSLMKDVNALKEERSALETNIKTPVMDMKGIFEKAFMTKGSIDEMSLSSSALTETFSPLEKRVTDNLSKQEGLITEIQKNYELLNSESGGSSSGGKARDDLLKQLASSYDGFITLSANVKEGNEFYNHLTTLLVNFQTKVSDFCYARKMEKEELLKDLTAGISKMSVGDSSAISPPAYHAETPDRPPRKVDGAPPRPPPPAAVAPQVQPAMATQPAASAPNPYAGAPGPLPYPTQPGSASGMPFIPMPYYMPPPPQGYFPGYPQPYPQNYPQQPYPFPQTQQPPHYPPPPGQ